MYDFFLGTSEEIQQDEEKYLLAIKRMLPRWLNSLPDSEYLAIAHLIEERGKLAGQDLVLVETGVGASTLVFIYYAMKYGGICLSWDLNSAKASTIRSVCNETVANHFQKYTGSHWKPVAYNSLSPYLGLPILKDLVDHVDLFFHDSDHVWNTISQELENVIPLMADGCIVALDDANQSFVHTNIAYVNTVRKKLGLPLVSSPSDNSGELFYELTEALLERNFKSVEHISDQYKGLARQDPYFAYFEAEFDINAELGTCSNEKLEQRFNSWRVSRVSD